jgi:hypothetical protein
MYFVVLQRDMILVNSIPFLYPIMTYGTIVRGS